MALQPLHQCLWRTAASKLTCTACPWLAVQPARAATVCGQDTSRWRSWKCSTRQASLRSNAAGPAGTDACCRREGLVASVPAPAAANVPTLCPLVSLSLSLPLSRFLHSASASCDFICLSLAALSILSRDLPHHQLLSFCIAVCNLHALPGVATALSGEMSSGQSICASVAGCTGGAERAPPWGQAGLGVAGWGGSQARPWGAHTLLLLLAFPELQDPPS